MTETPIELGRNLADLTGAELRAAGVATLEQLRELGWREALARWTALFPERINVNAARALAGAELDRDWRDLPDALVADLRREVTRLRTTPPAPPD